MGNFLRSESEIKADLANAYQARSDLLKNPLSYTINSGGGSRSVTNRSIAELNQLIIDLKAELAAACGGLSLSVGAAW